MSAEDFIKNMTKDDLDREYKQAVVELANKDKPKIGEPAYRQAVSRLVTRAGTGYVPTSELSRLISEDWGLSYEEKQAMYDRLSQDLNTERYRNYRDGIRVYRVGQYAHNHSIQIGELRANTNIKTASRDSLQRSANNILKALGGQ